MIQNKEQYKFIYSMSKSSRCFLDLARKEMTYAEVK